MPKPESQSRPSALALLEQGPNTDEDGFHVKLQALFAQVTALANQLRKTAALIHRLDNSPAAGWGILQIIEGLGPQTVPGIARIRTLSRQNIQTLVNRLESQGCVALTANPAHKRSGLVCLTDAGRTLLATVREREVNSLKGLLPQVSEARLVPATKLLCRLRRLLTEIELPPDKAVVGRPKPTRALPKYARRRIPASVTVEPPAVPASGQTDESEFPVNLL
jgi:DNA-binding MarR family transcriptional regulator